MADIDKMKAAFLAAHKAGDAEGARKLAAAIRQAQSDPSDVAAPAAEEPVTTAEGLAGAGVRGAGPVAAGALVGGLGGGLIAGPPGAALGATGGAAAAGLTQLVGDPVTQAVNSLFGTNYQMPSDAMADFFTRMGVPEPKTQAERVLQTAAQGAAGAGGMAALGKVIAGVGAGAPVLQASGAQMAAQPAQQIAGGAGAGAAGQMTAEGGGGPVEQLMASILGGAAGAGAAGLGFKPQPQAPSVLSPNRAAAEVANAESQGIKPLTSDVLPPGNFASKWVQTVGERIYGAGTGGVRETQQGQRVNAIRTVLKDFGADDLESVASDKVMADLAAKRGADLEKYATLKNEVIDRLSGTSGRVSTSKTRQAIDDQIAQLQSMKTAEVEPIIARLTDFKEAIRSQNLRNIEELRKQLGEAFKNPDLTTVRTRGEKVVKDVYVALREDMGDHIAANGQRRDFVKWKVANKNLSDMSEELKDGTLKAILAKGDIKPDVVNKYLFSKSPSEVRTLYRGLTNNGRANARTAILQKAISDAGGVENINPDRFATQVGKLSRSIGVFFTGDELRQVEGLARALNLTRRAQQSAANPNTGVQVAIPLGATYLGDLVGSMGGGLVAAGTIGLAARAYESAPVRNLLVKIAQTPKGSTEEAALVKRAIAAMQAQQTQEPTNGR